MDAYDILHRLENSVRDVGINNIDTTDIIVFEDFPIVEDLNIEHVIRNDLQNTHDSVVNNCVANMKTQFKRGRKMAKKDLLEFLKTDDTNVLSMIEYIYDNETRIERHGQSDREILEMVAGLGPSVREPLITSLRNCWENGFPICAVGRYNQIIGTLAIMDPENNVIRTKDTLKQELINKASVLSREYDETYVEGSRCDPKPTFIKSALMREYVWTNIVDKNTFDHLVDDWITYVD
jgi:hypothetical protein